MDGRTEDKVNMPATLRLLVSPRRVFSTSPSLGLLTAQVGPPASKF